MKPEPLYSPNGLKPAYHLRYSWTGWPTSGELPSVDLEPLKPAWERDGLRLLEAKQSFSEIQLAFSAAPNVSPVFLAARAKGRLQHAMRAECGKFAGFSRKVSVRSVGDNTTADVQGYIARQVAKEHFADRRFEAQMSEFTLCNSSVDLAQPSESLAGRYWFNLHIVLLVAERQRIADTKTLAAIRDGSLRIAAKKGHAIACLSAMPDHLHLPLRGNITLSPLEIALGLQNNLAYLLGQVRIWSEGFYAGTFSEYDFGAIRAALRQ